MDELRIVKLASGAELKISPAPFEVSEALFQVMMEEGKSLTVNSKEEIDVNLFKDLFCMSLSSKKIRDAVWACMDKALYNGIRITKDTFEPVKAREDYLQVCFEVAKENISPFSKTLYAQFSQVVEVLKKIILA